MGNNCAKIGKKTARQHRKQQVSAKETIPSHLSKLTFDHHSIIQIGRFGRPYGVRGWLHLFSFTDPIDNILIYNPWLVGNSREQQSLVVETGKPHGQHLIVKLQGVDDRNDAQTLTNSLITIPKDKLPLLNEGEYYWQELIGSCVTTKTQQSLGIVKEVLATGANDILVLSAGKREHLIPYTEDVIIHIDRENKMIVADWDPDF